MQAILWIFLALLPCHSGFSALAVNRHIGRSILVAPQWHPPLAHQHTNDLCLRRQWDANFGYCGESSFIVAGLYYGQYCSQWTARALASPGIPQSQESSQLLIGPGTNAATAAAAMRLKITQHNDINAQNFLVWVKEQVTSGYPVILGLFENESIFLDGGDDDYDHIIVAIGVASQNALPGIYHNTDQILISDNGLCDNAGISPKFLYSFTFDTFPKTRSDASKRNAPLYSLPILKQSGVAVEGIVDNDNSTIPVQLVPSVTDEDPQITHNTNQRPTTSTYITLTATVSIPDQSVAYNLYRYDDFTKVPTEDFNAHADDAIEIIPIPAHSGDTYTHELLVLVNETVIFRAVAQSAP